MKTLSEFDSLADAQAYTVTTYRALTASTMISRLTLCGLYAFVFDAESDDVCRAVVSTINAGGVFSFDPDTTAGAANIALFDSLLRDETYAHYSGRLATLYASLVSAASTVSTPYVGATQTEFDIATGASETTWSLSAGESVTTKQAYTVGLGTAPAAPVQVFIEAALSKDGVTWSGWQRVASFGTVTDIYETLTATTKATTAPYRRLRAVAAIDLDATFSEA